MCTFSLNSKCAINREVTVCNIKVLLDSNASALIVRKDVLHERYKILRDKKNKWSTMAGTFNITFVTEKILKFPKLNHSADIYAKCHLTNKLINYNLVLGRDILHELGKVLTLKIKPSLGRRSQFRRNQ